MTKNSYAAKYILFCCVLFSLCSACTKKLAKNEFIKIKVGMMFVPNVQFAPFYVALDKDYFAQEKLDVSFDFSSPMDAIQFVGIGKFDFVIGDGEQVIIARGKGLPIKYVMTIYSKYPVALASLTSKEIRQPLDLVHKTIGVPDFYGASYVGLKALLKKASLDESQINIISIGFAQAAALDQGRVDAAVVYLNNTPIQMRAAGKELNIIPIHQYVSLVSAGIITNDTMIDQYPEIVKKFVTATLKGLLFVKNNPEDALQICFKYIKEGANNQKIQYEVLKESIKLYDDDLGLGFSDPTTWENTQDILFELHLVRQKQRIDFFYTNNFVANQDQININQKL